MRSSLNNGFLHLPGPQVEISKYPSSNDHASNVKPLSFSEKGVWLSPFMQMEGVCVSLSHDFPLLFRRGQSSVHIQTSTETERSSCRMRKSLKFQKNQARHYRRKRAFRRDNQETRFNLDSSRLPGPRTFLHEQQGGQRLHSKLLRI